MLDEGLVNCVADAVRVEVVLWHGPCLVVHQSVRVAVEHRVDAQREDVLVRGAQHARVHDGTPGHINTVVHGLRAEDPRCAHLVLDLPRLVEDEGQYVIVVANVDDGLHHQFPIARQRRTIATVVQVLPQDAVILLVDTYYVVFRHGLAIAIDQEPVHVVDGTQTVAPKLEVVRQQTGADIS